MRQLVVGVVGLVFALSSVGHGDVILSSPDPIPATVNVGDSLTFTVSFDGSVTPPTGYEWDELHVNIATGSPTGSPVISDLTNDLGIGTITETSGSVDLLAEAGDWPDQGDFPDDLATFSGDILSFTWTFDQAGSYWITEPGDLPTFRTSLDGKSKLLPIIEMRRIMGITAVDPVPEPSTLVALISMGLMGLAIAWRRRRRAA